MTGRGPGWLIALVGVAVIGAATPDPAVDPLVSWTSAVVGAAAGTDRLLVEVDSVQVGTELTSSFGDVLTPDGIVVVVGLRGSALTDQLAWVVEAQTRDGRWYAERTENRAALGITAAGFTTVGSAVFVVPPDRVAGLRLAVTPTGRERYNAARGVLVDLGLTGREGTAGAVSMGERYTEVTR